MDRNATERIFFQPHACHENIQTTRFYPDRTARGDRHHRDASEPVAAGVGQGQTEGRPDRVHQQPQTVGLGVVVLLRRQRRQV